MFLSRLIFYLQDHSYTDQSTEGGYNVSKSFAIDLKDFTLLRTIGAEEKILRRAVDAYDVVQTLNDLGYNNLNEDTGVIPFKQGMVPALECALQTATLGVPSTAAVKLSHMAGHKSLLLLSFTF